MKEDDVLKRDIIKAMKNIFFLSMVAKAIAFFKSVLQASYFGATSGTDAFNMAQGVSENILYLLSTAIAVAFVPLYIQEKTLNKGEANKFATKAVTFFTIFALGLIAVLEMLSPLIMRLVAPHYSGPVLKLTIQYFRILALGFIFAIINSFYQNLLNAERIYGFSAASSIINSITLVLFMILFADKMGVDALVYAILASHFIQAFVLYIKGKNYGKISLSFGIKDERLKLLVIQAAPFLLSQASVEINMTVDKALLTSVGIGAVTSVSYATVLYQFADTVISLPISTVLFTEMSEASANRDLESIKKYLEIAYKFIMLIGPPIIIVTLFSSKDIVDLIYGHGNFSAKAVTQSSIALATYIVCLIPGTIKAVLSKAFYSLGDTIHPMIMGILEVALNIALSLWFVRLGGGIFGVIIATDIATIIFTFVMICVFDKKYIKTTSDFINKYWRMALSVIISLVFIGIANNLIYFGDFLNLVIRTFLCFFVYFGLLFVFKEPILRKMLGLILKKFNS